MTQIVNVRIYQKTKLNVAQKAIRWASRLFYTENYPVDMTIGFRRGEDWLQITAEVKNKTDQESELVRAFGYELRWSDIKDKPCSRCNGAILPEDWSHVVGLFQAGKALQYTRYCSKCYLPDYLKRPVSLFSK